MSMDISVGSLKAQGRAMEVIGQNIAHASDPNYSQKEVAFVTTSLGGVVALPEQRIEETLRTESVRIKNIEVSYLETLDATHDEIMRRYGAPGDKDALGSRLEAMKISLGNLQNAAEDSTLQRDTVTIADNTAKYVNKLGKFFQGERIVAENGLSDSVKNVNRILTELQDLNRDISTAHGRGETLGTLKDNQDTLLKELSQYMDTQVMRRDNGALDITTNTGQALLLRNGARTLSFVPSAAIGPADTPASLGKITVEGVDITNTISSGKIGGYIQSRDVILPGLQAELDEFTEQFRDQMNSIHNQGMGDPAPQVLTGNRAFATPGVTTMQMTGIVRIGVVDNTQDNNSFVAIPFDLDLTAGASDINTVVGQINVALGADGTAALNADGQLVLTATDATHGMAIVSMSDPEATETGTGLGFSHFFGLNDLFTTGTRYTQDGNASKIGLAQNLDVRADILSKPALLSRGSLSTSATAVIGSNAVQPGDASTITKMMAGFEVSRAFSTAGPLTGRTESLLSYANSIWHDEATTAKNNKSLFDIQNTILEESENDLKARTGVNMQEQIAKLMEAQQVYMASSAMVKAQKDMFDNLIRSI